MTDPEPILARFADLPGGQLAFGHPGVDDASAPGQHRGLFVAAKGGHE